MPSSFSEKKKKMGFIDIQAVGIEGHLGRSGCNKIR
jgi:hypothetical protein